MESTNNLTIRVSLKMQIFLIIFACFSFLAWTNAFACIVVNENYLKVKVFYGIFQINWDEIENISMNNMLIFLSGHDKRVVLSLAFANNKKRNLVNFLSQESQKRQINFEKTSLPLPTTHLNSRVWK